MKKGDTLIEVAIAIAIFSLVSIGVISVVSSSTSTAQTSLEVTLAREEIDAQAEALRFIHTSYIAGGKSNSVNNEKYLQLWKAIADHADYNNATLDTILSFNPSTCKELYESDTNIATQKAFVINTRYLGDPIDFTTTTNKLDQQTFIDNTIFSATAENLGSKFIPAVTYPRFIFANTGDSSALLDTSVSNRTSLNFYRDEVQSVQGLYVVAVKDQNTTTIVSNSGVKPRAAFYDFYIRTCWYAPDAEHPSTVSTVIRLQDPDVIDYNKEIIVHFRNQDGSIAMEDLIVPANTPIVLEAPLERSDDTFRGWNERRYRDTNFHAPGETITLGSSEGNEVTLWAVWSSDRFK